MLTALIIGRQDYDYSQFSDFLIFIISMYFVRKLDENCDTRRAWWFKPVILVIQEVEIREDHDSRSTWTKSS
jgi:hypothetical protein